MEEKFKDFLEMVLDIKPLFSISPLGVYDEATGYSNLEDFFCYREHSDPLYFRSKISKEKTQFIIELKNQLSTGQVRNNYLQNLKEELEKCIDTFYVFESNGIEYKIQKDAILNDYRIQNSVKEVTPNNVPKSYLKEFLGLNHYKFELITSLIQELESLEGKYPDVLSTQPEESPSFPTEELQININKLKINISVSDIALLFRLLDEEKILSYKYKTDIYRFIASSFKTEKQDDISEASVKNKFTSPDNTSIKNIDALLANMRQQLKKIQ